MKRSTRLACKALIAFVPVLSSGLAGCPKTIMVKAMWTSNGNSRLPCGAILVPPCLLNYTLSKSTGAVIATIPILDANGKPVLAYSFSASTAGLSGSVTLGLSVNEQTANGIVSSPKALSSVTVN